jgi:tetratricopeptide (TPR) repeat protein
MRLGRPACASSGIELRGLHTAFLVLPLFLPAPQGGERLYATAVCGIHTAASPVSDRSEAYQQPLAQHPSDTTFYREYASCLIANRDYKAALTWSAKGLERAPSDPGLRLIQAVALSALGDPEAALRILKLLPATGESRFHMALACRARGDHRSAQQYLSEAWKLGFRDPYALYLLIEEDHALGDKTAGLHHYQLFLTQFPGSPWLHVLYGNAYAQKSRDAQAIREYREALRVKPDLPGVNFRLGYLLYRNNEYALAAECFRQEITLNPFYSDASLLLAQTLRHLGRLNEAASFFRKAIELDPTSDLAYRALVGILTEQGNLGTAVEILRQAEKLFPTDPGFPAQLARILFSLNREEEALQEQEKFRLLKQSTKGGSKE